MTPPSTPPLAVYNPDLLSDADLRAQFVARLVLLNRLLDELRQPGPPQHHLLIGQRGMGKTTLLRRLRVAIEDDPGLSARWTALTFPEEQYNVAHLSDLWVNCIDALGDALDRRGEPNAAARIDALIDRLPEAEAPRAEAALSALLGEARARGGLVLLIDNLDLVLARLHAHQWPLRELLSETQHLVFIGASSQLVDGMADYSAAFYDFFASHLLAGLSLDEAQQVTLRLAELRGATHVPALLRDQPGRFKALHQLTGGNPRTVVLLFQIIAQQVNPSEQALSVQAVLEGLLDVCTPIYKARVAALAPQAQQVVDALALGWDPMTAAELATAARLEVNTASAQLNRLVKEGVVEQVHRSDTRRVGFQLAERFFNIWYLVRAGRRGRRRLSYLARFLELLYACDGVEAGAPESAPRVTVFAEPGPPVYRAGLSSEALGRALAQYAPDAPDAPLWPELVHVFADACAHGGAGDAAELLRAEGYDQRWRPLYAALRAVEAGDPAALSRFAPEVSVPAAELLRRFAPDLAARPPGQRGRGQARER